MSDMARVGSAVRFASAVHSRVIIRVEDKEEDREYKIVSTLLAAMDETKGGSLRRSALFLSDGPADSIIIDWDSKWVTIGGHTGVKNGEVYLEEVPL